MCDEKGALLIFDEVQTGLGMTGPLFAHEHYGVTPDIMTLAKGLANGVPMGAMGCTEAAAAGFGVSSHACTFGGNPLSSAAAVATLEALLAPGFLDQAREVGDHFRARLDALAQKHTSIVEVRGRGLMIGVEMKEPVGGLIGRLLEGGVICGSAGPHVLRFLPPLIVTTEDVDRVVSLLDACLGGA